VENKVRRIQMKKELYQDECILVTLDKDMNIALPLYLDINTGEIIVCVKPVISYLKSRWDKASTNDKSMENFIKLANKGKIRRIIHSINVSFARKIGWSKGSNFSAVNFTPLNELCNNIEDIMADEIWANEVQKGFTEILNIINKNVFR
jgi:hypothetical protein